MNARGQRAKDHHSFFFTNFECQSIKKIGRREYSACYLLLDGGSRHFDTGTCIGIIPATARSEMLNFNQKDVKLFPVGTLG